MIPVRRNDYCIKYTHYTLLHTTYHILYTALYTTTHADKLWVGKGVSVVVLVGWIGGWRWVGGPVGGWLAGWVGGTAQ